MTVDVEELFVILIVLGTGKPLIAKVTRRMLNAITASGKCTSSDRYRGIRFHARIIDIWIE